ncbi:MAG: DUF2085 domain-containing protein [bacterium]
MKKVAKFFEKNFYNLFLVFLIILNIAPILAPVFANIGWIWPAKVIYTIYSVFCHQFDWRSIHFHDYQFAWCTRDTFIWGAILTTAITVKFIKAPKLSIYWVIAFTIPIALDGGIQTIATMLGFTSSEPFYLSTNLLRMITGSLFGLGLGFWMMPMMYEIWLEDNGNKDMRKQWKFSRFIFIIEFFLLFLIYLVLVQIWRVTSPKYGPENFLDLRARMPESSSNWLQRRKHGM